MRQRRSAGFTLIELLIIVAILGIIVAIAVVNYLNAIDRARQRRSMADMRSLATALEAYAADLDRYPPAAAFTLPAGLDLPTGNLETTRVLPAADVHPVGSPRGRLELVVPVRDDGRRGPTTRSAPPARTAMPQTAPRLRSDDRLQGRHHSRERAVRSVARRGPAVRAAGGPAARAPTLFGESAGRRATIFVGRAPADAGSARVVRQLSTGPGFGTDLALGPGQGGLISNEEELARASPSSSC